MRDPAMRAPTNRVRAKFVAIWCDGANDRPHDP
jgi:hypothetical protein